MILKAIAKSIMLMVGIIFVLPFVIIGFVGSYLFYSIESIWKNRKK